MKFQAILASVFTFTTVALAQSIAIGIPPGPAKVFPGQGINVMVQRPNTQTGSAEIGISISLHHCVQSPCEDASQQLDTILYSGAFTPQLSVPGLPPHQNFSVTIPNRFSQGPAALSVAHAALVGAGPFLLTEVKSTTVVVE